MKKANTTKKRVDSDKKKLTTIKITDEVSGTYNLNEIGHGDTEVKFALIDEETGHTITPFVKCKDYINDLFWSNAVKKEVNVCGFNWKPNQDKGILNRDTVCIAIKLNGRVTNNSIDVTQDQLDNIVRLINRISIANNLLETTGILSEDSKHIVIRVDRKWFNVPYVTSTLFLLLRMGFKYKEGSIKECFKDSSLFMSPHDVMYLKNGQKLVEDLENGIIDTNQTYDQYDSGYAIHDSSGLVAYSGYLKRNEKK